MNYEFIGTSIYIGEERHVYPSPMPGVYWVDKYSGGNAGTETRVMVCDDFGNLVSAFTGVRQRHAFCQVLH